MLKYILLILCPIILLSNSFFDEVIVSDSLQTNDSTIVVDTVKRYPLNSHGSLFHLKNIAKTINKRDIQLLNYVEFTDILYSKIPVYKLNLGSFGQNNNYSFYGAMANSNSTLINGNNINNLHSSFVNPYQIATEFAENIEILSGSNAVVFGGKSGSIINIQEAYYNTAKPFTRLWFAQAGSEYLGVDALIAQNISRDWSYVFGFRSTSTANYFDNSWLKSWNFRFVLKWSPSERTSISFAEYFTNHGAGLNGGINPNSEDVFDPIAAIPTFSSLNERLYKHDLSLNFTSILDVDSTHTLSLNAYFSNAENLITYKHNLFFNVGDSTGFMNFNEYFIGANGRYELELSNYMVLRTGGTFQYSNLPKTYINSEFAGVDFSAYGHINFDFSNKLVLSGGARLYSEYGIFGLGIGGKIETKIIDSLDLSFDFSISDRTPAANENFNLFNEKHLLGIFELDFKSSINKIGFGAFFRLIDNPIVANFSIDTNKLVNFSFVNEKTKLILGTFLNYSSTIFDYLKYNFQIQTYYDELNSKSMNSFPILSGKLNLYYEYKINKNIVQLGGEIEVLTGYKGYNYNPLNKTYSYNSQTSDFQQNGLNLYANVKLARTFVKISFNNLLSSNYFYVAYYPNLGRNLRLTVAWSFDD